MDIQFAGTDGNGVFRRPLSELVGIKPISNNIPEDFMLYQNYPNPFNPTTKIKFAIPPSPKGEGLGVRLKVNDILGREIQTLVNEHLKPGTYEADFDGSNYASGIYFYNIETGEFKASRMMVLVK